MQERDTMECEVQPGGTIVIENGNDSNVDIQWINMKTGVKQVFTISAHDEKLMCDNRNGQDVKQFKLDYFFKGTQLPLTVITYGNHEAEEPELEPEKKEDKVEEELVDKLDREEEEEAFKHNCENEAQTETEQHDHTHDLVRCVHTADCGHLPKEDNLVQTQADIDAIQSCCMSRISLPFTWAGAIVMGIFAVAYLFGLAVGKSICSSQNLPEL